ncbi:MAG: HAMP domain-containing sensor histidine kinase, partial [Imperialibacter sp.]
MGDDFFGLLTTNKWPPRWVCGEWTSLHGWFYIFSDISIGLAYFTIPFILFYFIRKRRNNLPFVQIFWLFILFILACGTTHFVDATLFWFPAYHLSAAVLFITGIISWVAVIGLVKVLPEALQLKTTDELETTVLKRTDELQESNKKLREINSDLDNFVYAASHDLKSPINNIEGLIAMLKSTDKKDVADEVFQKIEQSVSKVRQTIDQISSVVKIQRTEETDVGEVFFDKVLAEVLEENVNMVATAKPQIIRDFAIGSIHFSHTTLKSIMYNLVTNALKYRSTERDLEIQVRTFSKENRTYLSVEDNGLGIDLNQNREKLFSIFSRFHDHVEGSGIGDRKS